MATPWTTAKIMTDPGWPEGDFTFISSDGFKFKVDKVHVLAAR